MPTSTATRITTAAQAPIRPTTPSPSDDERVRAERELARRALQISMDTRQ
jgi:hypothetical protein